MTDKIDKMYTTLNKIKQAQAVGPISDQMQKWIDQISSKEYGLVKILIAQFLSNFKTKADFADKILKVLHNLSFLSPKIVQEQFIPNTDFPKAIVTYIQQTKLEQLTPVVFNILVEIFLNIQFTSVATKGFIMSLFDCLEFFEVQEYLSAVVFIIVGLCVDFQKKLQEQNSGDENEEAKTENPVLDALMNHKNARYFGETLVKLLNNSQISQLDKCIRCVAIIFQTTGLQKEYFYTNDLPILQDILIRETSKLGDEQLRLGFLNSLLLLRKNYPDLADGTEDCQEFINQFKSPLNDFPQKEVEMAKEIEKFLPS